MLMVVVDQVLGVPDGWQRLRSCIILVVSQMSAVSL